MNKTNKFTAKKSVIGILIISVIAVTLIPMLYSSIYLSAFWDVYGKLDNVPVAFVSMDKPIVKDNKKYNIGQDLQDNLKDNKKVQWNFVNYDDAKSGVEGNKYYAMIVIPEDFSKKIADSKDGVFNKPEIIYEANKGRNYIFSQISEKVATSIKSEIAENIQEETSKALVDNLYDIKKSLGDASDGANKLQDGTQQLYDGSKDLSNGLIKASNGSGELQKGLKDAAKGESQVYNGINSLSIGLNQLKEGLVQKNDKVDQLVAGAKGVSDGASSIYSKASDANIKLSQNLNSAATGIKDVSSYINTSDALVASVLETYKTTGNLDVATLMKAQAILDGVKSKDISSNIAYPLSQSANSLQPLVDGLGTLKGGAKQVADGTSELVKGIEASQIQAAAGVDQLIAGTSSLKEGSGQILQGLNTATDKTGELSSGLSQLSNGANTLNSGLNDANEGSKELKNGLNSGYTDMTNNLKFTSDNMANFVKEPVVLNENTINNVEYYGEGLAPYFVSLSLWLGAMFINLLLSLVKKFDLIKGKFFNSFLGKFVLGTVIAVVQALLVSIVLTKGLNIHTVSMTTFFITNMFISVVYFSVMYGASHAIGIVATPIMFIIFLLQLASSGGTFPIETAPTFFKIINEYIPMTYAVSILRMVTSGINSVVFNKDIFILLIFMLAFLCGGLVIRAIINTLQKEKKSNENLKAA